MEVMIGIVILGLGMILVATMFPVAWGRARTLSEFTVQRTITAGGETVVRMLTRVSSPTNNRTSFAGDFLCDELNNRAITACDCFPADTWVHALNLENVTVTDRRFVSEDLWQDPGDTLLQVSQDLADEPVIKQSYFRKRISFRERIYPPIGPRANVEPDGVFAGADDPWDAALDTRRFAWAVLHRLRSTISNKPCVPDPPCSTEGLAQTRSFDMYYVTLRRSQPTLRFARQDVRFTPDLCLLDGSVVQPRALPPTDDVLFPVPWRVQVEFPDTLAGSFAASGLPTEITVPPTGAGFNTDETTMMIQMFPRGAQFIDEITGAVYRVVKRRVTVAADKAVLTLDREVVFEDIDLPIAGSTDPLATLCPSCGLAGDALDLPELVRTVWVFPPPAQPRSAGGDPVVFVGVQPVVGIDIRPMTIAP